MAKFFYEHIAAGAGFSGEQFDIAAGGANTGIIDVLLSAGALCKLTEDAPHVLISTGALFDNSGGGIALELDLMEVESAGRGGAALDGRFFYLSIQNSNITTENITVTGSGTINGAADFVIATEGDYLFHHITGGAWRANVLPRPAENMATLARISFAAAKWDAATANTIVVKASAAPGAGEIGPHNLTPAGSYIVQVINTDATPDELVDVEVQFDASGDITLKKAAKGPDFAGVVIIAGSLD